MTEIGPGPGAGAGGRTGMGPIADQFVRLFGAGPDGLWHAPGRVNLIGEHTDYNDGFVLPFALQFGTIAAVRRRADGTVRVASLQRPADDAITAELGDLTPPDTATWPAYPLGVAWALRNLGLAHGADILVDGDIPVGAGLSSSASLECAVALALADGAGLDATGDALADACRRAENEYVGVPTGIMDQIASMSCASGHALFLDTLTRHHRHVPFDPAAANTSLLVLDTGVRHHLASSAYPQRRKECREAANMLGLDSLRGAADVDLDSLPSRLASDVHVRRTRHVLSENRRVLTCASLLETGELRAIGPLLTEGHRSLETDFAVSCPEIDTAVDACLAAGALGARLVGGGFGGSVIALVDRATAASVVDAVAIHFAELAFPAPRAFEAVPSNGACRVA